jgi:hypothetical protein
MTSLSHQRRGARRYGWFDAYVITLVLLFAMLFAEPAIN